MDNVNKLILIWTKELLILKWTMDDSKFGRILIFQE